MTNAEAWNYAIGIIKVDGLEPTEDFKEYIEKEKRGEITIEDAKRYLDKKYKMKETENA
ncbi:MAG: antitoxin VbhA family protein [Lachnospiraceae bacterium]|nr:antitoxin VbhA family protein [Lachnospiraceae bacterium]